MGLSTLFYTPSLRVFNHYVSLEYISPGIPYQRSGFFHRSLVYLSNHDIGSRAMFRVKQLQ